MPRGGSQAGIGILIADAPILDGVSNAFVIESVSAAKMALERGGFLRAPWVHTTTRAFSLQDRRVGTALGLCMQSSTLAPASTRSSAITRLPTSGWRSTSPPSGSPSRTPTQLRGPLAARGPAHRRCPHQTPWELRLARGDVLGPLEPPRDRPGAGGTRVDQGASQGRRPPPQTRGRRHCGTCLLSHDPGSDAPAGQDVLSRSSSSASLPSHV